MFLKAQIAENKEQTKFESFEFLGEKDKFNVFVSDMWHLQARKKY